MAAPTTQPLIVYTAAGPQPTPPATIQANIIAYAEALSPGYTADLPGILIEDISSTDTAAVVQCEQTAIDLGNSVSPYYANPFILPQQGQMVGVNIGAASNTSVYVVFTAAFTIGGAPAPGVVIAQGFTVQDEQGYQYTVQDGGVTLTGGVSEPLYCLAVLPGSWTVPPSTVTTIITQPPQSPTQIALTVSNPNAGTPGGPAQTEEGYRSQVLQAWAAPAVGCQTQAKTNLQQVPGVQPRLISINQINGGGWECIVGGGDPYAVAYAIYSGILDVSTLVGSTIGITGITNANPGVVTTDLYHGLTTGQANVHIASVVGMTGVNGGPYTVTVISPTTFSFGVNTTSSGAWTSGGVVTPNARNLSVNLYDAPNTYAVPLVLPPQETVTITVTWNTTSDNVVSNAAIQQAAAPALVGYINSIFVGQPINVNLLNSTFTLAIAAILPPQLLTRLVFSVSINGTGVSPTSGTFLISGDPESYFYCDTTDITIAQG